MSSCTFVSSWKVGNWSIGSRKVVKFEFREADVKSVRDVVL